MSCTKIEVTFEKHHRHFSSFWLFASNFLNINVCYLPVVWYMRVDHTSYVLLVFRVIHMRRLKHVSFLFRGAPNRSCAWRHKQVAQLSQRDRAAGCVTFGQKWKNGNYRQYLADSIGPSSTNAIYRAAKPSNSVKKHTQNKNYYAVQGHSRSPRSVPIESPHATSYQR